MAEKKEKTDFGQAEVQKAEQKAEDKGYIGNEVDPIPDREYSLKSGPEGPTVVADIHTRVEQHSTTKEKS